MTVSQWQPIETAPKDGTKLLLWIEYDDWRIGWYHDKEKVWYDGSNNAHKIDPTDWMNLTKPARVKNYEMNNNELIDHILSYIDKFPAMDETAAKIWGFVESLKDNAHD